MATQENAYGSFANYAQVHHLGEGGMGHTILVIRNTDNRLCVLKTITLSDGVQGKDPRADLVRTWTRECELLRTLEHPGIPKYYDSFYDEERDRYCIVMEYIEGETLEEILEKKGTLSDDEVADMALQVLSILEYLHTARDEKPIVLHRDIKPSNLVRKKDGTIVLIDFGIACYSAGKSKGTQHTSVLTIEFASPEHVSGFTGPQSDLYCLGRTMEILLTGANPIPFDEAHVELNKLQIPLVPVIVRATKLEKTARYESAHAMKEAIRTRGEDHPSLKKTEKVITREEWQRFVKSMKRVFGTRFFWQNISLEYGRHGQAPLRLTVALSPPANVWVAAAVSAAVYGVPEHARVTVETLKQRIQGAITYLLEYKDVGIKEGCTPPLYFFVARGLIEELLGETEHARKTFQNALLCANPNSVDNNIDILLEARDGIERIDRGEKASLMVSVPQEIQKPPETCVPFRTKVLKVLTQKIW